MKRFLPYFSLLKPLKWKFLVAVVAGAIAAVASGFGFPFMIKSIFPLIFVNGDTGEVAEVPGWMEIFLSAIGQDARSQTMVVLVACCFLPMMFIIRGVFGYINMMFINWTGMKVLEAIRLRVFERLQRLSLSFHQKRKEGDLLTRVMDDTQKLQDVVVKSSSDLIIQPLTLVAAIGFLVWVSLEDSKAFFILIALLSLPACVLPMRLIGVKLMKKAESLQTRTGDLMAAVSENLSSQQEVRAYNMQDQQVGWMKGLCEQYIFSKLKVIKYKFLIAPAIEIIAAMGISFAIYFSSQDGMDLPTFMSMVAALFFAYEPVKKIGTIHSAFKEGEASLVRLEEILYSDEEILDVDNGEEFEIVRGEIGVHGVSFSYANDTILNNVNVDIRAGQTVALVGPSGVGKSTFASLILRFYEVQKGKITVDGVDISLVSKHSLREQIALVSQNPLLFRGSIRDNILVGKFSANEDELIMAAKKAHAHDFIMGLPDQYDTQLGERGEGLSGGQRQRVAIARAFLKDAPILILDEATSSLDTESEAQIQIQLKELAAGRTTLLIAHRFSSIREAERILVFGPSENGGGIVGDGSHEELYQSCDLYRSLYDRQGA